MPKPSGAFVLGALLSGLLLLAPARYAAARGETTPLQPVSLGLQALFCQAEGDWCPPTGVPPRAASTTVSELGIPARSEGAAFATSKRRDVRTELALEVPELPGLAPVGLDTASVVCYTEGEWCLLLPADQQPRIEQGL